MWIRKFGHLAVISAVLAACSSSGDDSPSKGATGGRGAGASRGLLTGGANNGSGADSAQSASGGDNQPTTGEGGSGDTTSGSGGTASGVGGDGSTSLGGNATGVGGGTTVQTGGASSQTGGSGGACAETSSRSSAIPPVLEFVIDASYSMTFNNIASTNGLSKWAATTAALNQSFAALPSDWAVGITYFNKPTGNATYQGRQDVPIAALTAQQLDTIDTSLTGVTPGGLTPTLVAWQFGLQQLTSWAAPAAYAQSPRYIVLITDGVPTVNRDGRTTGSGMNSCITQAEYDYFIQTVASQGVPAGVKTFVVGVPGSDDPQGATYDPLYQLSLFARAGGTEQPVGCTPTAGTLVDCLDPFNNNRASTCLNTRGTYCLFDMTLAPDFTAALVATLRAIATQVITCSYTVPTPPDGRFIDPNYVKITYTTSAGEARDLRRATDSSCSDGQWYVSAEDAIGIPTQLDLCPDTCDTVSADVGASILVTFTCIEQM